ncbi:hypothetical protein DFH01_23150 [Falsiroseomonas bella]|uniref:Uncharacterized protein n=1 Tax=Falsiroseomonas bella TaxID=2184016 RepID=A0A317F823_9PROT|nr:hypothetical protein [Falsiroseomonas bella]PWS35204.1 hypothetical protein DFH01_23150 [Falsiroseomonas bella]
MPDEPAVRSELDWVLARFPEDEALVRRLFLTQPAFRSTCEDYRLAREGLSTFEELAVSGPRAEVGEYRTLVRELEAELLAMFRAARDGASPPDAPRPGTRNP